MKLLVLFSFLFSFSLQAQIGSPLTVESDTIALWNFDNDSGDTVIDSSPGGHDGQSFAVIQNTIPGIDPAFGQARQVTGSGQLIDFGLTKGSAFDFENKDSFTVEAIIHLTGDANEEHIIFFTDQVLLLVNGNKLGGFIRTTGGLRGILSEQELALNTTYRVAMGKSGSRVALLINGNVVNQGIIETPISQPSYDSARVSIGGSIFGLNFPGYIDDVRVSSSAIDDVIEPTIVKNLPVDFVQTNPRPNFDFDLSDLGSGVDVNSIEVYLNDVKQENLNITASKITGQMDQDFVTTQINEVRVIVSDIRGNISNQVFLFRYSARDGKGEYEVDEYTLALWHMDDFSLSMMMDSGPSNYHGYGDPEQLNTGLGIFGKGRYFIGSFNSKINVGSIKIPDNKFTFETWIMPTANNSTNDEVIFSTGQIEVQRFNEGYVRIVFNTTYNDQFFESSELLLPIGESHHLAISWDGSSKENNLLFFIDGLFVEAFNSCLECDLNPLPSVGKIGENFSGMMDEMRFSSITRGSFNIPNTEDRIIEFLTLKNGSSVSEKYPELNVNLNSGANIDPANVEVYFNDVLQQNNGSLVVTGIGIDGTFAEEAKPGINYVEIKFIDESGEHKKKTQYFFYIEPLTHRYYEVDEDTIAQWSFEKGQEFHDSSNNGYHLVENTSFTNTPGIVGDGIKGSMSLNDIEIPKRAFTIEGNFKWDSLSGGNNTLWSLNGNSWTHNIIVNSTNGDLTINLNTQDLRLDEVIAGAYPLDSDYHHIALVYDNTREHAQLLLLIDGSIVRIINLNRTCNLAGSATMSFGGTSREQDEVRVSSIARYKFALKNPQLELSSTIENGETISDLTVEQEFQLTSPLGVDSTKSKVTLNGIETNFTVVGSGNNVTLRGNLVNAINGQNEVRIIATSLDGGMLSKRIVFYHFKSLTTAAYSSSNDTVGLYHFDESTGTTFVDSSSYGHDLTFSSSQWTLGNEGVFNQAASSNFGSANTNLALSSNLTNYSIEFWLKDVNFCCSTKTLLTYPNLNISKRGTDQLFIIRLNNLEYAAPLTQVSDDNWHHYAVVVDQSHPYAQLYILIDGNVVLAQKIENLESLNLNSVGTLFLGSSLNNSVIDELRISSKAQYELVSTSK